MGARSRCALWARVYGTPKPLQILDDRIIIGFGIEPSRESLKPPLPYCDPWHSNCNQTWSVRVECHCENWAPDAQAAAGHPTTRRLFPDQKRNFNPNCMILGSFAPPGSNFPKLGLSTSITGPFILTRLKALNVSARNCTRTCS